MCKFSHRKWQFFLNLVKLSGSFGLFQQIFCQMAFAASVVSKTAHGHLRAKKSLVFPMSVMRTSARSHIAKTGHGGKRYKLSKMRPSIKSNMARWKPHNGQLIPKSCLYAQGSSKNTFHSD